MFAPKGNTTRYSVESHIIIFLVAIGGESLENVRLASVGLLSKMEKNA